MLRKQIFVVLGLFLISGCHLRLDWGPPGTIGMQRSRAVLNDPFPSDELGPTILGARPRGFDLPEPRAEGLQKYTPQPTVQPVYNPYQVTPQPQAFPQTAPPQNFPVQPQQFYQRQYGP